LRLKDLIIIVVVDHNDDVASYLADEPYTLYILMSLKVPKRATISMTLMLVMYLHETRIEDDTHGRGVCAQEMDGDEPTSLQGSVQAQPPSEKHTLSQNDDKQCITST
jgi:hypothetical protein